MPYIENMKLYQALNSYPSASFLKASLAGRGLRLLFQEPTALRHS